MSRRMIDVLIVGCGAREHALAWKLRQSPEIGALYVAPGNAGTLPPLAEPVPLAATDVGGILRFVQERDVMLTVVGPEAPLALGLADRLRGVGRRVFGPDAAAARIEASKSFAKELMARCGVPTARYAVFDQPDTAMRYLWAVPYPVVVKADGLAAGKGVTVCEDVSQARDAVRLAMVERVHGEAGSRIVIEETLTGPEVSLLALVDGERVVPLPVAQDHKRLGAGDTGPNTGGMGAYAPVPFLDSWERDALTAVVLEPVVAALAAMGTPYRGVLFAGLMLTPDGPKVLEFNCRFGDPEAQVILPLLADDLLPWLDAIAAGRGRDVPAHMPVSHRKAVGVVLAAPGYPEAPRVAARVEGIPSGGESAPEGILVFHGGTALDAVGRVITAGGRVLTVVGMGDTIEEAAERAYDAPIWFEGMQRRSDIAWQGRTLTPSPSPARGRGESVPMLFPPLPRAGEGGRGVRVRPPRIGVLASGDGSNLQALLDACAGGAVNGQISIVVSHRAGATALERARRAGVPAFARPLIDWRNPEARRRYEMALLELLDSFHLDLVVLAGWMMILSSEFLARCSCPILNVHPALLPEQDGRGGEYAVGDGDGNGTRPVAPGDPLGVIAGGSYRLEAIPALRGAHAVRDALALALPFTGVSVHHVTAEVDAGPVVLREIVPIEPGDDEETLYRRIKAVEHRLLPRAVQSVLTSIHAGGVYA